MKIYLNDILTDLPNDYMTVEDLLKWKDISTQGTAVAIDNKLIKKMAWGITKISPLCHVNIISAAYGG